MVLPVLLSMPWVRQSVLSLIHEYIGQNTDDHESHCTDLNSVVIVPTLEVADDKNDGSYDNQDSA